MGERYISDPVVYNHFPGGFGGVNHTTRVQIYGGPVPYRPGVETPLGRLLSAHANLWSLHPSQLLPRALTEELDLSRRVRDSHVSPSVWSSNIRGLFRGALIRDSFNQASNQSIPEQDLMFNQEDSTENSNEEQAIVTVTDAKLYSEIRDLFERDPIENEPKIDLVLHCPICSERLRFTHPTHPERFVRIPNGTEWLDVLPCGHIMGLVCMLDWTTQCRIDGRRITCPVCRFDLQHSNPICGHPIMTFLIEEGASLPPLTVPEGGYVYSLCPICGGAEPDWGRDRHVWN
ncbi:hypothetical protein F4813DRAFT_399070 [Daldinia decipiens]|uniref:uncharacterized protein n=1 Tax=Daldinia decipiens TaxID=326647 RepID=UPI0020C264E5|nr:uncharacterized protein F4813DRAFT_399070 [Daldinia decipiens]KAI1654350.1 hypothetical protein F4813DRAFT_399070 [Daldinia decipiens]